MIPLVNNKGLLISFAAAALFTIFVVNWLRQEQRKYGNLAQRQFEHLQANSLETVFAKTDIPQGRIISEEMVYVKFIPRDSVPPEAAPSVVRVVERIARQPIKKDSIIMSNMLAWATTKETTLAMRTPIGRRAITISVDNISSLVGMIKPGDYVDAISLIFLPTMLEGKQAAQPAMAPLFQNIQVLAVGSQLGRVQEGESGSRRRREEVESKESAPLITLALTPEEANLLAFAQEQGKIRLILRSPGDARTEDLQPANWETLLRHLYPNVDFSVKEVKKEIPPQVEVIRGLKKEMMPLIQKNER